MSEVLFDSMTDHQSSTGTLRLTTAGMTHRPNRVCARRGVPVYLLLKLVYEYPEVMQFSACTPLQMRVDS
jgi:hypothetical protein